jgi:hypothetical protein
MTGKQGSHMTKADVIRAHPTRSPAVLADWLKCRPSYVSLVRWRDQRPGYAAKMKKIRKGGG